MYSLFSNFEFYYEIEGIKNSIIDAIIESPEDIPAFYQECAQKLAYYQAEYRIGLYKEEATQGVQKILFILRNIKPLNSKITKRINRLYDETIRRINEYGNSQREENY